MNLRNVVPAAVVALFGATAVAQPMRLAQELLDQGRIEEAIPHLEEATKGDPDDPAPIWMLAVAHLQLGDFAAAAELGSRFGSLAPENPNGPRLVGSALVAAGRLEEAEDAFRSAVALDPENPVTRLDLALLLARMGETGEARASLESLAAAFPGRAEVLGPLGALHAREGRRAEALQVLVAAVRAEPGSAEANHHLGALYSDLGRLGLAERHLGRALEQNPENPASLSELCLLRSRQDRLEEARGVCSRAAEVAPEDAETWFRLADVLQYLQDDSAEPAHRRALGLDPGHRLARFRLGLLLWEQNRSEEAIEVLTPAVEATTPPVTASDLATGLQTLGLAHRSAGDIEEARLRLEQAIRSAPTLPEPHLHLGNLLARSADPSVAALGRERLARFREVKSFDDRVRSLKAAVNADPAAPGPKRDLVRGLMEGGALDRALDEAGLLFVLSRDEPVHHELLAAALLGLGREDEAAEVLDSALERWPDRRELRELRARIRS